ncbi:type II toxin-antitoxin system Phd/YefM family antitoxin [Desulfurivibrio sp. D14AmB]|uniref:type II toxin-antitoxin system Phd/YefM family antitoxin n=1 Tax=Desulfurivibrio sp. D14AmB TaxID=3374370 RepID=UPI00376F305B
MQQVNITEFRNHLPKYLARTKAGETLEITSRGRIVARLAPPGESARIGARQELEKLRSKCRIGDVISPIDEQWDAASDNS